MQLAQHWMTSECTILLSLAINLAKDQGQDPRLWWCWSLNHGVGSWRSPQRWPRDWWFNGDWWKRHLFPDENQETLKQFVKPLYIVWLVRLDNRLPFLILPSSSAVLVCSIVCQSRVVSCLTMYDLLSLHSYGRSSSLALGPLQSPRLWMLKIELQGPPWVGVWSAGQIGESRDSGPLIVSYMYHKWHCFSLLVQGRNHMVW